MPKEDVRASSVLLTHLLTGKFIERQLIKWLRRSIFNSTERCICSITVRSSLVNVKVK